MNVLAKAAVNVPAIQNKIDLNGNKIEIQLLNEFVNNDPNIRELCDVITSVPKADIFAVHSPLLSKTALHIEEIGNEEIKRMIWRSCEIAHYLGIYYKHIVKVIVHSCTSFDWYKFNPALLESMVSFVKKMLGDFPNIELCIENTTPVSYEGSWPVVHNGCFFDNVKLAHYLCNELNTTRVGTVLDTCHMLTTMRFYSRIFDNFDINEETFFRENQDVIKLIHLSDVIDLGMKPKTHGIKFVPERYEYMKYLISLYKEYNYKCDVTIEIIEDDYLNCLNFAEMSPVVKEMLASI